MKATLRSSKRTNASWRASSRAGSHALPFRKLPLPTTPDYHYVLDAVPGTGAPIILAGGGSGHATRWARPSATPRRLGAGGEAAVFLDPARPAGASSGLSCAWIAPMAREMNVL